MALIELSEENFKSCAWSFHKMYPERPDLFAVCSILTTGVLTATIWEQTRRAGITAAAGTRLALCLLLTSGKDVSYHVELVITPSFFEEWESFAPAATHGYSRYLSGAFSGSTTVTARYP